MVHAESAEQPVPRETLLSMSGLEFVRGMLGGRIPAPPISRTLGYRLAEVDEGRVVFAGAPGPESCNPLGTVHGGWYGTLLDSAMACAVQTRLPKGSIYTTLEYKVNVIRPIPLGHEIRCEGTADHVGRSTGVARGRITDAAGTLYATGSTTCIVMTPKAA